MPRPRKLDDNKRNEICALATAGMQLSRIAQYIGCCTKTIQRERRANAEFDQRMRRAEMAAQLSPLQAMRRAAATHWRAAAWMLEREDRQQAARDRRERERKRYHDWHLDRDQFATLTGELLAVVRTEVADPLLKMRLEQRLEAVLGEAAERPAAPFKERPNPSPPMSPVPARSPMPTMPAISPGGVAASIALLDHRHEARGAAPEGPANLHGELVRLWSAVEQGEGRNVACESDGPPETTRFCPRRSPETLENQGPLAGEWRQNQGGFDH